MMEGAPGQRKHESKEAKELFRATLGFDFVFEEQSDGIKKPICIEINGDETGIKGMRDLPKNSTTSVRRAITNMRSDVSPELKRKQPIARELFKNFKRGELYGSTDEVTKKIAGYVQQSLKREKFFTHAYTNSPAIELVAENKRLQQRYIPESNRPREYDEQHPQPSKTGLWIVKDNTGRAGINVFIVKEDELPGSIKAWEAKHPNESLRNEFIIQELIHSADVDEYAPDVQGHPAAMRLLIDFVYMSDGSIRKGFEAGYQRISRYPVQGVRAGESPADVYVVNKYRGARSLPASRNEIESARIVAEEIISHIGSAYKEGKILENAELDLPGSTLASSR